MEKRSLFLLLYCLGIFLIFLYSIFSFPVIPEYVLEKKLIDLTLGDIVPLLVFSFKISIVLPLFLYATHLLIKYYNQEDKLEA